MVSFNRSLRNYQSLENPSQNQEYKFSGIRKRRCHRYIPIEPDEQLREFLRDRYRQSNIKGTPPAGPFCACGLQREEHKNDAIVRAPPDVALRERLIVDSIRRSRSGHNKRKLTQASPLEEHVNRSQSPFQQPLQKLSSDWNVLTDTVEEPTDVDYEFPISWEQDVRGTLKFESSIRRTISSSLDNLAANTRVLI